ncbi:unnamed protein product [Didymodactylos carnosus]|uniref:phosphatidylserine decarboxylase n=1 Tax=Didymodactylos carnosus TaxID=1234261 RepID=A0A815T5D4_9BILA|nr:unnamed protein product [Didymodactylos carnosus]CAF1498560.1 unnamed protein product [Didymodactylos carnosus]CAF4166301.1 unnamed protein product [Didymodactylos carnosus]CAF4360622.1 unnamed protein product [Didymodactylos carnosus]
MDSNTSLNQPDYLSHTTDHNEIQQIQHIFSNMITQTVENSLSGIGNIFDYSHGVPNDWLSSFFPQHLLLHQYLLENHKPDESIVRYAFKVMDRKTNTIILEKMPDYTKFGLRLMFDGRVQRELLHTEAIKHLFAKESLRLGQAFDEPQSRDHIESFMRMYQLSTDELFQPDLTKYGNFNEFFYRKLKPDARQIAYPDNSSIITSVADCRLILFDNVSDATRIWIKGQHFSLKRLFDDELMAKTFDYGSIAVFRLAPNDYHRFHSPVSGQISKIIRKISGTYYTVNPIVVRENLDVFTENHRAVMIIDSKDFGPVAFVAIGALLVGSINFTVDTEQYVNKGDELGKRMNQLQFC